MQFHNRHIIVPVFFSILLIAVSASAYTIGRMNAEHSFFGSQLGYDTPVRLAGGIVETWGAEHIFYTTYCGSGCLGFEVTHLTTGQTQRGFLGFLSNDNAESYTVFEDWNGEIHRFDGEFVSVRGREHGEKRILDFVIKDEKTGESVIHSVEF